MMNRLTLIITCLILASCTQQLALFDYGQPVDPTATAAIDGFYSTEIFSDFMSDEVWVSKEGDCVTVMDESDIKYAGDGSLHIVWDKISSPCPWIGMGFGWDNWAGKNLGNIYDHAAIQFKIRAAADPMKSFPVAMCLEDYGNLQAWTGFSRKMLDTEQITKDEWSTITIPILEFNFQEFGADISNIKQFMIQFEAAGDVYIDDIKIVEHQGSLKRRATLLYDKNADLNLRTLVPASSVKPAVEVGDHDIYLAIDDKNFYVHAIIKDDTPLQNGQDDSEIWNGDAIEIALGTDHNSSSRRAYYQISDKQIGFKACPKPYAYDWRAKKRIEEAIVFTEETNSGYILKAQVPLTALGIDAFILDKVYGLEIAIDLGTNEARETQMRWNSPDRDGFHKNPSIWGEMHIIGIEK